MFTLHHLNDSRSQRIIWLLELAQVEYEIKVYQRDPQTSLAPDTLKKIHPLGTSPILTHNDTVIAESGAICEYIARYSQTPLMPAHDSPDYIEMQFWSHYAEGSFLPPLVTAMVLGKARQKIPFLIRPLVNKVLDAIMNAYFNKVITRNFAFVEHYLADKTWLVGDTPTLADVQMSFALESVYDAQRLTHCPNMRRYVENLRQQSEYKQAMDRMRAAESAA